MVNQKAIPIRVPQAPADNQRSFAARWKHQELFARGYVPVPLHFFEHYAQLKPFCLTTGEAMFVLHLMQFKWDAESPFPGYKKIAAQMGISHKMARAHAKSLETKGLLIREMRVSQTNRFDLTLFFDALHKAVAKTKKSSRVSRPMQQQASRKAG